MRRSMICLFMSVLGGWGVAQTQWPFLLLHKGTSLSVLHTADAPYQQHLMNFAVDTELFSTIVPIFFWLLLKRQDVTTNAHWPIISQIYEQLQFSPPYSNQGTINAFYFKPQAP